MSETICERDSGFPLPWIDLTICPFFLPPPLFALGVLVSTSGAAIVSGMDDSSTSRVRGSLPVSVALRGRGINALAIDHRLIRKIHLLIPELRVDG